MSGITIIIKGVLRIHPFRGILIRNANDQEVLIQVIEAHNVTAESLSQFTGSEIHAKANGNELRSMVEPDTSIYGTKVQVLATPRPENTQKGTTRTVEEGMIMMSSLWKQRSAALEQV